MKERDSKEVMRSEFLSQPVLGTIVSEFDLLAKADPRVAESLKWIGVSGSKARKAEVVVSDDDLVVLMERRDKFDPLNLEVYDQLLDALNRATGIMIEGHGIIPVYVSTIRLEDAQMAIARLASPNGLCLHTVHSLIYPSVDAVIAFEPPALARGLFGQSLGLWGGEAEAMSVARKVREGYVVNDPNLTVGGLDGISDNFRMLRTNRHILPPLFLAPQTVHVLDYSLKWAMAAVVEKTKGVECGTWEDIVDNFPTEEGGEYLVGVVNLIRDFRTMGEEANLDELEDLYRQVIRLWPVLTNFRMNFKTK